MQTVNLKTAIPPSPTGYHLQNADNFHLTYTETEFEWLHVLLTVNTNRNFKHSFHTYKHFYSENLCVSALILLRTSTFLELAKEQ